MLKAVEGNEEWAGFDSFCSLQRLHVHQGGHPRELQAPPRPAEGDEGGGSGGYQRVRSDGKALSEADIKAFEKLPSKQQLIAMIAGAIKAVPTKVAVGVRQVPTKLAVGVKKISEGDSEPSAQAAAQG